MFKIILKLGIIGVCTPVLILFTMISFDGGLDKDIAKNENEAMDLLQSNVVTQLADELEDDSVMSLTVTEELINLNMHQSLFNSNEATIDSNGELVLVDGVTLVGTWVNLTEDKIMLNVQVRTAGVKSTLKVRFHIKETYDYYEFGLDKIVLGNLSLFNLIFKNSIEGFVFDDFPQEEYPYISVTEENYFRLDKFLFLDFLNEQDDLMLLSMMLEIMWENELFVFAITENKIGFQFAISKIANFDEVSIPSYLQNLWITNDEGEKVLEGYDEVDLIKLKIKQYMFNKIADPTLNEMTIDDALFNKVLYSKTNGFSSFNNHLEIIEDDATRDVLFGLEAIWFEIYADSIKINALFNLDSYVSKVEINLDLVLNNQQINVYEVTNATVGRDENSDDYINIDQEKINLLLSMATETHSEFFSFENNKLTFSIESLQALLESSFESNDLLEIESINVVDGGFQVQLKEILALEDIVKDLENEISNIIVEVGNGSLPDELKKALEEFEKNKTTDNSDKVFEIVKDLSPEDTQKLNEIVSGILGDEFKDIIGI